MATVEPTLDDAQVMQFVATGCVLLEGVIEDSFNQVCNDVPAGNIDSFIGDEPFTRQVLLNPQVAGVARSLLGEDFLVPAGGHHHLYEAPHLGQTWHSDGLSGLGHDVTELQCYYYPQSVEIEDGPTMILPGSHCRAVDREAIAHYGDILGQVSLTVPAGTIAMTRYGIWHKAGPKTNKRRRGMLKFSYHRQAPPKRDWKIETPEIPDYVNQPRLAYVTEVESYRERVRCMRTWNWLCGLETDVALRWERSRPVSELA